MNFLEGGSTSEFDALLLRVREGDTSAFAELFGQYQPMLLRFLRTQTDEVEDVASEVRLSVIRDLRRFHGDESKFRSWLFTIARHRAIDAGRAAQPRRTEPVAEIDEAMRGDWVPDAADSVVESSSTTRALKLIASLPRDQAQAVALRVIAGLDVPAVAEIMGKKPGSIRVLVHRGLRTLAGNIEPREDNSV